MAAPISTQLTPAELRQATQGDVVIRTLDTKGRPGASFEVFKLMHVGLPALYATLTCFRDYPRFMPNVERLEVRQPSAGLVDADYFLALPMKQTKRYRLRLQAEMVASEAKIQWKQIPWPEVMLKDSIADTQGYWLLQAASSDRTWVKYQVYTDPGPIPFGLGWIVDVLTRVSLPDVLNRTEDFAAKQGASCSQAAGA
ncbi:MAG: hypothetical protein OEW58_11680 [Gammaproteobacteria bacterium]|nr:hypothetical protein [Gammaproteobacteria bacterium]